MSETFDGNEPAAEDVLAKRLLSLLRERDGHTTLHEQDALQLLGFRYDSCGPRPKVNQTDLPAQIVQVQPDRRADPVLLALTVLCRPRLSPSGHTRSLEDSIGRLKHERTPF